MSSTDPDTQPLISVIMPVKDAEPFLEAAIDSVFSQSYRNLEVICVDDGSADRSMDIAEAKRRESPFPFKIVQGKSGGSAMARNIGMNHARGPYIQFLDADDLILEEKISQQVALLKGEGDIDLVVGKFQRFDKVGNELSEGLQYYEEDPWYGLMVSMLGVTSANLWKKDKLLGIGGWEKDLKSSQEYELMFRILKEGGKVAFAPTPQTVKREVNQESISNSDAREKWARYLQLRKEILDELGNREKLEDRSEAAKYYQAFFDILRTYYSYDPDGALAIYDEWVPKWFVPIPSAATSKSYILVFRILGFRGAERLRSLLGDQ